MDAEKKKTTLGEDAEIYNRNREELNEKEKWQRMTKEQKKSYFMTYYFKKLLLGIFLVVMGVWLIYDILRPKPQNELYVAIVNDYWYADRKAELKTALEQYMGLDGVMHEVMLDDAYQIDTDEAEDAYSTMQRMMAYTATGDLNIIISDETRYIVYVMSDYFYDLEEVLPEDLLAKLREKDLLFYGETADGVKGCFGIRVNGLPIYDAVGGRTDPVCLGIIGSAKEEKLDYAISMIRYLVETEEWPAAAAE